VARELFQDREGKIQSAKAFNAKYGSSLKLNCFLSQNQRSLKKKVITGFGVCFWPKIQRSLKKKAFNFWTKIQRSLKKKGSSPVTECFWPKISQINSSPERFLSQIWPRIKAWGGGQKSSRGDQNISRGGQLPPHFPRLWSCVLYKTLSFS